MMHNEGTFQVAEATAGTAVAAPVAKCAGIGSKVQFLMNWFLGGLLLLLIQFYRRIFSPAQTFLFGGGSGCRFTPTCSVYAAEAIRGHGAVAGGILALKRICRCHPLGGCGLDPVPQGNGRKERHG